jgi:hypothetical protein
MGFYEAILSEFEILIKSIVEGPNRAFILGKEH